jgi:putative transposase
MNSEVVTRRRLLHWYQPGYAHFVTYRLVNSIPKSLLQQWRNERATSIRQAGSLPYDARSELRYKVERLFFKRYDEYLDRNCDRKWLADTHIAKIIRENLYHHNESKYQLLAYCVMPNHVHLLLQPFEKALAGSSLGQAASLPPSEPISDECADSTSPLAGIMHSLKSYTANKANEALNRTGPFWQHESYDHWVRDLDELERIVNYIRANPVRAGLCDKPTDWEFSSAHDRFKKDGSACALVGWLRDDWKR